MYCTLCRWSHIGMSVVTSGRYMKIYDAVDPRVSEPPLSAALYSQNCVSFVTCNGPFVTLWDACTGYVSRVLACFRFALWHTNAVSLISRINAYTFCARFKASWLSHSLPCIIMLRGWRLIASYRVPCRVSLRLPVCSCCMYLHKLIMLLR